MTPPARPCEKAIVIGKSPIEKPEIARTEKFQCFIFGFQVTSWTFQM
jgi:hypothetical protein